MAFSDTRTTIVLGAGSSCELGLPMGKELKTQIGKLLDIRYEQHGWTRISGSQKIDSAFRLIVEPQGGNINPFLEACWKIRDAMPQAKSIDNYLDTHANDDFTVRSGKLAIVQAILDAERLSQIHISRETYPPTLKFNAIEETWFNKFFQLLIENCRVDGLVKNLSNVTIISFNYDRCLKHFLYYAIQNYYRVSAEESADILSNLKIYHPYGNVGDLPWESKSSSIEYGAEVNARNLVSLSDQIRTFTEGNDPQKSDINAIHSSLANSNKLIFLGFAFHPMNMKLLKVTGSNKLPSSSFGTALGLSKSDCALVENEIKGICVKDLVGIQRVELRNDLSCAQLLDEYRRSLTS